MDKHTSFALNNNLKNKVLLYDDTCPLCVWYTGQFVERGMLSQKGRISFADLPNYDSNYVAELDWHKSKHEIPLIDVQNGHVLYGLDSLMFIVGKRFFWIKHLMKIKPIYAFFKVLYKLVSYNRRIIVPTQQPILGYDCTPDFNLKYRLVYIFISLLASFTLAYYFAPPFFLLVLLLLVLGCMAFLVQKEATKQAKVSFFGQIATLTLILILPIVPLTALMWALPKLTFFFTFMAYAMGAALCYKNSHYLSLRVFSR